MNRRCFYRSAALFRARYKMYTVYAVYIRYEEIYMPTSAALLLGVKNKASVHTHVDYGFHLRALQRMRSNQMCSRLHEIRSSPHAVVSARAPRLKQVAARRIRWCDWNTSSRTKTSKRRSLPVYMCHQLTCDTENSGRNSNFCQRAIICIQVSDDLYLDTESYLLKHHLDLYTRRRWVE